MIAKAHQVQDMKKIMLLGESQLMYITPQLLSNKLRGAEYLTACISESACLIHMRQVLVGTTTGEASGLRYNLDVTIYVPAPPPSPSVGHRLALGALLYVVFMHHLSGFDHPNWILVFDAGGEDGRAGSKEGKPRI